MSLQMIIFGIQAVLRAGQAGADLYGEHARDRAVFLPDLSWPEGSLTSEIISYVSRNGGMIEDAELLKRHWVPGDPPTLRHATVSVQHELYALVLQHQAASQLATEGVSSREAQYEAERLASGRMVEQWRAARKPPSAWARIALTITDIGLEFLSANPSIFGAGSKGETLIKAFAEQMETLIPDDVTEMGFKEGFADRVFGIFLRAGLGTIESNTALVIKDEDVAKLVAGIAKPIVEALPETITDQMNYRKIVDALAGPAAEAAFQILADNTDDYLGRSFEDDRALGALTSALFKQFQETASGGDVLKQFGNKGMIRLYEAGLKVAVDRPKLFIAGENAENKLFQSLFSNTAKVLINNETFKGPIGTSLAAMAIETVGEHAPILLKLSPDEPWENVAIEALEQVTSSINAVRTSENGGALSILNENQILDLGRILLEQAAKTPDMLGIRKTELKDITSGIAAAMAADTNLLLTSDDWIKIAGVAAEKAAANPDRLFGTGANSLATEAIKSVLSVADNAWSAGAATGRDANSRLFGDTLRNAIIEVIEALGGNVTAIVDNRPLIGEFMTVIANRAQAEPKKFGSDTIKKLIRILIGDVLANGSLPNDAAIDAALAV